MTVNRIIQHIYQQPDIKQVDEAALEQMVSAFPYFTAARLLHAKKQYSEQKNLLSPAVKKAQLYSTNMHYFYRFITSEEPAVKPEPEPAPVEAVVLPAPAPVEEVPAPAPAPVEEEETPVVEEAPAEEEETPVQEEETPAPVEEVPATSVAEPVVEEARAVAEAVPATSVAEPVVEQVSAVAEAPAPVEEVPATSVAEPAAARSLVTVIAPEPPKEMAGTTVASSDTEEDEQIKIFPLEMDSTENTLTYQPLYTDDYFAYKRLKEPDHAEELSEKAADRHSADPADG